MAVVGCYYTMQPPVLSPGRFVGPLSPGRFVGPDDDLDGDDGDDGDDDGGLASRIEHIIDGDDDDGAEGDDDGDDIITLPPGRFVGPDIDDDVNVSTASIPPPPPPAAAAAAAAVRGCTKPLW